MLRRTAPVVSIGIPAHDGGRFVAACIESILVQTFSDFELIISDDASTDATGDICRRYAARDPRIRYDRNVTNLGAAPNFNRVFALASGRYFKWAAQDDLIAPSFLARCLAALDADPGAVLCHSWTGFMDETGAVIGVHPSPIGRKDAPDPVERFASVIRPRHMALELYGLIRADALRTTGLFRGHPRSDTALVAELALTGRFIEIPEPLFFNRDHPRRYTRVASKNLQHAIALTDASKAGQRFSPTWTLCGAYFGMVKRHVPQRARRLRCYGHVLRSMTLNRNTLRLAVELVGLIEPRAVGFPSRVKQLLRGALGPSTHRARRVSARAARAASYLRRRQERGHR